MWPFKKGPNAEILQEVINRLRLSLDETEGTARKWERRAREAEVERGEYLVISKKAEEEKAFVRKKYRILEEKKLEEFLAYLDMRHRKAEEMERKDQGRMT